VRHTHLNRNTVLDKGFSEMVRHEKRKYSVTW
jgi:hypothetical protein